MSVMSSVFGRNGSCRFCGQHVDMPLVSCLMSSFSRSLIQQKQVTVPVYYKSYWISRYVNKAFKRSHFHMPRSQFCVHHMPIILLFLPLQPCENSEGGPPCNSIALGAVWAYYMCSKVFVLSSAASYILNNAPLC